MYVVTYRNQLTYFWVETYVTVTNLQSSKYDATETLQCSFTIRARHDIFLFHTFEKTIRNTVINIGAWSGRSHCNLLQERGQDEGEGC